MKTLNEFEEVAKSQSLNLRFVCGGGRPTEYTNGDDWSHTDGFGGDSVIFSGLVPGGGTSSSDPEPGAIGIQ